MKQYQIINAYRTLETLSENENLSDKEQWSIYKLRKFLRPSLEFYDERVEAIRNKYQDYIDDKGMINGPKAGEYISDMNSLNNLEVELEKFDKPKIQFKKGITCKITEPLEDFVEFLEPAE